jgi:hypothetical protein
MAIQADECRATPDRKPRQDPVLIPDGRSSIAEEIKIIGVPLYPDARARERPIEDLEDYRSGRHAEALRGSLDPRLCISTSRA